MTDAERWERIDLLLREIAILDRAIAETQAALDALPE